MTSQQPQPRVLALDASGSACSVAIGVGETVLVAERIATEHGQVETLLPMIDAAIRKAGLRPSDLDLVATTVGPGSFTGIRIGMAAARGIALATGAQLIGVTGFEAVATIPARSDGKHAPFMLISLESRREELYVQLFDEERNPLEEPAAVLPTALAEAVNGAIGAASLLIAGDAAQRAALTLAERPQTTVLAHSAPDAVGVLHAALRRRPLCKASDRVLPLYLRPPDVTLSSDRQLPRRGR